MNQVKKVVLSSLPCNVDFMYSGLEQKSHQVLADLRSRCIGSQLISVNSHGYTSRHVKGYEHFHFLDSYNNTKKAIYKVLQFLSEDEETGT